MAITGALTNSTMSTLQRSDGVATGAFGGVLQRNWDSIETRFSILPKTVQGLVANNSAAAVANTAIIAAVLAAATAAGGGDMVVCSPLGGTITLTNRGLNPNGIVGGAQDFLPPIQLGSGVRLFVHPSITFRLADAANCWLVANDAVVNNTPASRDHDLGLFGGKWDANYTGQTLTDAQAIYEHGMVFGMADRVRVGDIQKALNVSEWFIAGYALTDSDFGPIVWAENVRAAVQIMAPNLDVTIHDITGNTPDDMTAVGAGAGQYLEHRFPSYSTTDTDVIHNQNVRVRNVTNHGAGECCAVFRLGHTASQMINCSVDNLILDSTASTVSSILSMGVGTNSNETSLVATNFHAGRLQGNGAAFGVTVGSGNWGRIDIDSLRLHNCQHTGIRTDAFSGIAGVADIVVGQLSSTGTQPDGGVVFNKAGSTMSMQIGRVQADMVNGSTFLIAAGTLSSFHVGSGLYKGDAYNHGGLFQTNAGCNVVTPVDFGDTVVVNAGYLWNNNAASAIELHFNSLVCDSIPGLLYSGTAGTLRITGAGPFIRTGTSAGVRISYMDAGIISLNWPSLPLNARTSGAEDVLTAIQWDRVITTSGSLGLTVGPVIYDGSAWHVNGRP